MAWNDGSRFLTAHGVKWGTGPKFYKGSKHDTYWNKDLLWKLYVQQEARKHGVAIRTEENKDNLEVIPPLFKSLEAIRQKKERVPFDDPYAHDLFKTNTKSARVHHEINRARLGQDAAAGAVPLASSRSRSGLRPGTSSSLRSAGATLSSPAASSRSRTSTRTNARLQKLEQMVAEEGKRRKNLEAKLRAERNARQRTEANLQRLKRQVGTGSGRIASARSPLPDAVVEKKLKAYDTIMAGLLGALKAGDTRRSARE